MKHSTIDWAPFIPNDWEEKRIKDISHLQSGNGITSDDIDHIGLYPVYGGNGLRGYTDNYTNDGDYVLIGRQGALCGNINYAKDKFYASEHAVVVYPYCKDENTIWLGETLRAANLNRLSASAAQPGLAVSALNFVKIPYPPESQRERIGEYLDEKCSEIDGQVALLEKKRDAYARLKVSVINKVVTHGLNPDVSMRPSGIDWIGDIPAHWSLKRFKEFAYTIKGKGSDYLDEPTTETDIVLTLEVLRQERPNFYNYAIVADRDQHCTKDDLVIIWDGAGVGEFLRAKDGVLSSTIAKINVDESKVLKDYLWQWRYMIEYRLKKIPTGMGIPHLNPTLLNQYLLAVPPLAEQRAIAEYLDKKCGEIDAVEENLDKQIDAYKRLKKSLINEVVTGKRAV